jgi:tetratricopeptide (TPR) repeat protein
VTRLEPNDFTAWRALAGAQLAEGLPGDAAESYRQLVALTSESDPNDVLSYADALRLAGRSEEARALYQKLVASNVSDVAAAARQRMTELSASALPTPTAQPTRDSAAQTQPASAQPVDAGAAAPTPQPGAPTPAPAAQPTPQQAQQLTPDERYRRGVELWGGNRGAAVTEFLAAARSGNPDAYYYLGLNLVEGKNLSTLKRAEVVAALRYFQTAQSGSHGAQARRYVQQLEKEFDRVRGQ